MTSPCLSASRSWQSSAERAFVKDLNLKHFAYLCSSVHDKTSYRKLDEKQHYCGHSVAGSNDEWRRKARAVFEGDLIAMLYMRAVSMYNHSLTNRLPEFMDIAREDINFLFVGLDEKGVLLQASHFGLGDVLSSAKDKREETQQCGFSREEK